MDWLNCLNDAVDYIEKHLQDDININKAAQIARCSTFHFQRMFSYIADMPLSEYIRRRKMTLAAAELQSGNEKVIDIALKYGYESPTAFNRAFQSIHGIAPSNARINGISLKAYPPISFKITIIGEAEMNYRIEKREAFRIVGLKEKSIAGIDESFKKVPLFWERAINEGAINKLCSIMNHEPYGIMGVSTSDPNQNFDYYIAVSSDKAVPSGMAVLMVPEATWAIFECIGPMPEAIQTLQKRVISEWLPASGYEYANAPDIEVYFDGDQKASDYRCEVWLPVTKK